MSKKVKKELPYSVVIKPLAWNTGIKAGVLNFMNEVGLRGIRFTREGWFILKGIQVYRFDEVRDDFPTPYTMSKSSETLDTCLRSLSYCEMYERDLHKAMEFWNNSQESRSLDTGSKIVTPAPVQCKSVLSYFSKN